MIIPIAEKVKNPIIYSIQYGRFNPAKKLYQCIGELELGIRNCGRNETPPVTNMHFIYPMGLIIIHGKDPRRIVPKIIEE